MSKIQYVLIAIIIAFIYGLLITSPAVDTAAPLPQYVASVKRAPFHDVNCQWAWTISDHNLRFYTTREAAIKDGHRPCKLCNP